MEHQHHEPVSSVISSTPALLDPATRRDGWTGEKMALFCETLAQTAVVAEACDEVGMGIAGAYSARRRNPVFAAAWDAALTIARERLADTLLARSMEGNVEQIYKEGVLVGERHLLDNRLGLALLRRLDRLAETGLSTSRRGERAPTAPAPRSGSFEWETMVNALRTGDSQDIAAALATMKGHEVEGPPPSLIQAEEEGIDLSDRCWKDDGEWLTSFPPPPGFDSYESDDYGTDNYERACTRAEADLLQANEDAADAEEQTEDEALRDAWFEMLRNELETTRRPALDPGSAFTSASEEESRGPQPDRATAAGAEDE